MKYYEAVKAGQWEFPSFKDRCPICGAKDCAVNHGFYYRGIWLYPGERIEDLPIARYLCRGKGKRTIEAVTFSLLPQEVVPYRRLALSFMLHILLFWKVLRHTIEKTVEFVYLQDPHAEFSPSPKTLSDMQKLFDESLDRLRIHMRLEEIVADISGLDIAQRRAMFLKRLQEYSGQTTDEQGILALDCDYWSLQGDGVRGRHFLFGTPSQFRFT